MYGVVVTNKGWSFLARRVAGETIDLTRVMVGQGRVLDTVDPATLEDLISPVAQATSNPPYVNGSTLSFFVEYRSDMNGGLPEGFWLGEWGVFARDPDEPGEEDFLIYYASLDDKVQYVAPYTDGAIDVRRFPLSITLTKELHVSISYPAVAIMTAEEIDDYATTILLPVILDRTRDLIEIHNLDPAAHPGIRTSVSQVEGRVSRLEDMFLNDVTGYTFFIEFASLAGLKVTGVWNEAMQRIEF